MEPELYEYENDQKEDYTQDEWYYQNSTKGQDGDLTDFDDMDDGFDMQEEPDWFFGEDNGYEPQNEI